MESSSPHRYTRKGKGAKMSHFLSSKFADLAKEGMAVSGALLPALSRLGFSLLHLFLPFYSGAAGLMDYISNLQVRRILEGSRISRDASLQLLSLGSV